MPIKSRNLPPNLISGADALKHPVMLAAEKRAREELRELQDTYVEECRRAAANDPHGNFEKAVKASDWLLPTREALLAGKLRDKSLPRFDGGDYVFTSTHGRKPISSFSRAKRALDSKMLAELGELPPYVLHDVRRSMRTGLSALPVPDLIRELVIGHTKPGLHKIYDQHAYVDEKRHALELWWARLQAIVEPPPDNIVAMKRVAG